MGREVERRPPHIHSIAGAALSKRTWRIAHVREYMARNLFRRRIEHGGGHGG